MSRDFAWDAYIDSRKSMIKSMKSHSRYITETTKSKRKVQQFIMNEDDRIIKRCLSKLSYIRTANNFKDSSSSSSDETADISNPRLPIGTSSPKYQLDL